MEEEQFAVSIREVAHMLKAAEISVAKTEAELKREIAKMMVKAELEGSKSAAAQSRYADECDSVYDARVSHGIARGELAFAKAELKAREVNFDTWRTKMATLRSEKKVYGT